MNRFLKVTPEQVIAFSHDTRIRIDRTIPERAYGLFDSKTGVQVNDFVKSKDGQIDFSRLNPTRHYDVGAVENIGNEKPQFAINWNNEMRDNTEEIFKNSDGLPVVYPREYYIIDKGSNSVFDLADAKGERVGEVIKLSGDNPRFECIWSMRMKDDK